MRLFVSIDLPEHVRERLNGWLPGRPDLRCVKKEQLHLTLLFLGKCDENEVPLIISELNTVQFEPFEIKIQGVGAFPNQKNPKVIWAGINKSSELINLQKQISDNLLAFVDDSENRSFKPHITLARTTKRFKLETTDQLFKTGESIILKIKSISLKRSELSAGGSTHTTLEKFHAK